MKGPALILLLALAASETLFAQVYTSEFLSDPVSKGWELGVIYCDPVTWNDEGWYHQQLDHEACPPGPEGAADAYRISLQLLNGAASFFTEFRVVTDGDRSGIPYGVPTILSLSNNAGVLYHMTVAADLVKFLRDVDLPIWYIDLEPSVPHTYRIELYPDRYAFYVDAYLIDEGVPEGAFPAHDSRITWIGKSWDLPCHNAWDYIRYGVIPEDASGDFDSDAATNPDRLLLLSGVPHQRAPRHQRRPR